MTTKNDGLTPGRFLGYLLAIFLIYALLYGMYYLITGKESVSILEFCIITIIGLTIDFSIKHYVDKNWWTLKDIYNKLIHKK